MSLSSGKFTKLNAPRLSVPNFSPIALKVQPSWRYFFASSISLIFGGLPIIIVSSLYSKSWKKSIQPLGESLHLFGSVEVQIPEGRGGREMPERFLYILDRSAVVENEVSLSVSEAMRDDAFLDSAHGRITSDYAFYCPRRREKQGGIQ